MRYYGTFTGRLLDEHKQKVYQEGEEPEYWDAYLAEMINVTDESGNSYERLLIKATQKTALRLRCYVVPNNRISFDCKEITDGVVIGIRNVCSSLIGLGDFPYHIITVQEYITKLGHRFGCVYCKYRNSKKGCMQNCVN